MVIPWVGFPIAALLKEVEPRTTAKFVRFVVVMRPEEMPGQDDGDPRLAVSGGSAAGRGDASLAIFATGMYGKPLTNQQGRAVPPRGAVEVWLQEHQGDRQDRVGRIRFPATAWNNAAPDEYGFYANVNPTVDHPRWSQRTERRIGETGRQPTLMFNGYEEEVASLYAGMDLARSYCRCRQGAACGRAGSAATGAI